MRRIAEIVYRGISSDNFGIKILNDVIMPIPERRVEFVQVEGRHGVLSIDTEAYEVIDWEVPVKITATRHETIDQLIRSISRWLTSVPGWHELHFSGWEGVYYRAMCVQRIDAREILRNYGETTLRFKLHPVRYFDSGNEFITLSNGSILHNPGNIDAEPIINVTGNGVITLTIAGKPLLLRNVDTEITIDAELETAYNALGAQNDKVYTYPIPKLPQGECVISWTGSVSRVEILPRWGEI